MYPQIRVNSVLVEYVLTGNCVPMIGDIVNEMEPLLRRMKLSYDCVGGGRIEHNVTEKTILVFGYSQGFGKADHSLTCEILRNHFKGYTAINWSDEGY